MRCAQRPLVRSSAAAREGVERQQLVGMSPWPPTRMMPQGAGIGVSGRRCGSRHSPTFLRPSLVVTAKHDTQQPCPTRYSQSCANFEKKSQFPVCKSQNDRCRFRELRSPVSDTPLRFQGQVCGETFRSCYFLCSQPVSSARPSNRPCRDKTGMSGAILRANETRSQSLGRSFS